MAHYAWCFLNSGYSDRTDFNFSSVSVPKMMRTGRGGGGMRGTSKPRRAHQFLGGKPQGQHVTMEDDDDDEEFGSGQVVP